MDDWKRLHVGDKVVYHWNEFDGKGEMVGTVTEVEPDHVIVLADSMNLWLDDDTKNMFDY